MTSRQRRWSASPRPEDRSRFRQLPPSRHRPRWPPDRSSHPAAASMPQWHRWSRRRRRRRQPGHPRSRPQPGWACPPSASERRRATRSPAPPQRRPHRSSRSSCRRRHRSVCRTMLPTCRCRAGRSRRRTTHRRTCRRTCRRATCRVGRCVARASARSGAATRHRCDERRLGALSRPDRRRCGRQRCVRWRDRGGRRTGDRCDRRRPAAPRRRAMSRGQEPCRAPAGRARWSVG